MLDDHRRRARTTAVRTKNWMVGVASADRAMNCPPFGARLHKRLRADPDYTRLAAFAAALQRLDQEGIAGAIAEVGVFQGATSAVLQAAAPGRQLHLFDTFAGFPQDQLDVPGEDERFRDTSAEMVRGRLPADALVTLHPGTVPDTLEQVAEEPFAFVLLDLDISEPTRAALEFFWTRMPRGAYLFVHDYHNPESLWAAQRVLGEFLQGKDELLVDLPDIWGSVVLRRGGAAAQT
jgi:O-methyltransferase